MPSRPTAPLRGQHRGPFTGAPLGGAGGGGHSRNDSVSSVASGTISSSSSPGSTPNETPLSTARNSTASPMTSPSPLSMLGRPTPATAVAAAAHAVAAAAAVSAVSIAASREMTSALPSSTSNSNADTVKSNTNNNNNSNNNSNENVSSNTNTNNSNDTVIKNTNNNNTNNNNNSNSNSNVVSTNNNGTNSNNTMNGSPNKSDAPRPTVSSILRKSSSRGSSRTSSSIGIAAQPNGLHTNASTPIPPDSPAGMGPMPGLSPSPAFDLSASALGGRITGGLGWRTDSPSMTSPVSDSPLLQWSSNYGVRYNNINEESDAEWEELDKRVQASATYRELWHIVRMCSVQPSCHWMVRKLEDEVRDLIRADLVRVFLVKRDGLHRSGSKQSYPMNEGITGYVCKRKALINISNPQTHERYNVAIDGPGSGHSAAVAMLCLPIEANHRADCSGGKDVVAVFQAYKLRSVDGKVPVNDRFSTKDARVLFRLGEFVGNMLRTSSKLDQAQALYNASLTTSQRSTALLDVTKMLASETTLDRYIFAYHPFHYVSSLRS
jgi:hypothetical protein